MSWHRGGADDENAMAGGARKQLPFVTRGRGEPRYPSIGGSLALTAGARARLERVPCLLCQADDDEPIIAVADWRYGLSVEPLVIVRCRRCGLSYLNPRPVGSHMHHFYPSPYYERRQVDGGASPEAARGMAAARRTNKAALDEQAQLCERAAQGGGAGRSVLDVGCASGVFLASMRQRSWDVLGVEISADAAAWGERELGLEIIDKPLTEAKLPAERFDVVTFWSSLEHFHDPLACLTEARRILKPGGAAVILVPNFASPTVRHLHWGLDPPRHLYHFTPATLELVLRRAGFEGRIERRSRTRIEDGALHGQVAKIGRLLRDSARNPAARIAGWSLARLSPLMAPFSWCLTAAGLNAAMIVTARAGPRGHHPARRSRGSRIPPL